MSTSIFKSGIIVTLIYSFVPLLLAATKGSDKKIFAPGDLLLAAFFPVHEAIDTLECGKIEEEGFRELETFLYTVKTINKNKTILPNITLGMIVLDTCGSSDGAIEAALKHLQQDLQCKREDNPTFNKITAVIGGRSSGETIQLANLFRIFKIPQVSYKATAPSLSNKKKYEYFFRTVPPISHQAEALIEIIKYFNWTFISVVYSHSEDGSSAFESFHKLAAREDICIATERRVHAETFKDSDYDEVIHELLSVKARAVVLLGEKLMAQKIMAATNRTGVRDWFAWLGNENWCYKDDTVENYEEYAEGAICITYGIKAQKDVLRHFQSLTVENNAINPWFREFWEMKRHCGSPDHPDEHYYHDCLNESNPMANYTRKMPTVNLVSNAVYSIATALHDMHRQLCEGRPGMCDALKSIDGEKIRDYLRNVTISDHRGTYLKFDEKGNILRRYFIVNYRKQNATTYRWRLVGNYTISENSCGSLILKETQLKFKSNRKEFPKSVCSVPCLPGQGKKVSDSMKCCWICYNCTDRQYVNEDGWCETCDKGRIPSKNKTFCENVSNFMSYRQLWAPACLTLAVLGMLATAAVSVVFWMYWETPIVKASARELSALLLLGIFLSFLLTFAIINKPTAVTCACVRFFLGFSYTLCYAAVVVKSRLIARIFENDGKFNRKSMSRKSQLLMAVSLVSIEVVINITWFIYDFPTTEYLHQSRGRTILICKGSNSALYLLGLLYPFLLMILCTGYAYKTRKCPDGFNEARYITFTNYSTCVIWIIFLPSFSILKSTYIRTVMLSLLVSLSSAVHLVCLFFPKVYIAILKPQNNTRDLVMGHCNATPSNTTTSD